MDGGYEWQVDVQQGSYTLSMQTKDIVSGETLTIRETSGNIAFTPESITLANAPLTGNIVLEGATFPRQTPFVALEKADGTRIGSFRIEDASEAMPRMS